jgi:hypothetical protein|tara:strand:+ start:682 stop:903 length:222 start_codon:yes stop_codon:yes gene_type:complete
MQTNAQTLTKLQAQNLLKLWDDAIGERARQHWEDEDGREKMEYEEAFEAACWDWCISEEHMNDALLMRDDLLV